MACIPLDDDQQCICIERRCLYSASTETVVESVGGDAYSTWDLHIEGQNPFDFGSPSPPLTLRGLSTPRAPSQLGVGKQAVSDHGKSVGEGLGFHEVDDCKEAEEIKSPKKSCSSGSWTSSLGSKRSSQESKLDRTGMSTIAEDSAVLQASRLDSSCSSDGSSTPQPICAKRLLSPFSLKVRARADQQRGSRSTEFFDRQGSLATAYTIRTDNSAGEVVGLDLHPFTRDFDQHFQVDSQKIHYILDPHYHDQVHKLEQKKNEEDLGITQEMVISAARASAISIGVDANLTRDKSVKVDQYNTYTERLTQKATVEVVQVAQYNSNKSLQQTLKRSGSTTNKTSTSTRKTTSDNSTRGRKTKTDAELLFLRSSTARNQEIMLLGEARQRFDDFKQDPGYWGISVSLIWAFWQYIQQDLINYSDAHYVDNSFRHICLVGHCRWHHTSEKSGLRGSTLSQDNLQSGVCKPMSPNMHLVVQRYVKPWTEDFEDAGLAIVLNSGRVSTHKQIAISMSCRPTVFISHCWNERFDLFSKSLKDSLDPDTVVWICSFAIWQHGDIQTQLGDLEECPFAVALRSCQRVLLMTDITTEAVTRSWCVLEAELSRKWDKHYDMCLHDDSDVEMWKVVGDKIEAIDLYQCEASVETDKEAILEYARRESGVMELNRAVKAIAKAAKERARLMAAAAAGDMNTIVATDGEELKNWRSVRGRSLIHIAASCGRVAVIALLSKRIGKEYMSLRDDEGNSPLGVAAACGALSSVQALLAQSAEVNETFATGCHLTPLHFAAEHGHAIITLCLVHAAAEVECEAKFQGVFGRRPLHVAARLGHTEVAGMLIRHDADLHACSKNGMTALFHAVSGKHTDTLSMLLALTADANQANTDVFAKTPLIGAVSRNSPAMVSILLEARADPRIQDGKGQTCLQYMSDLATSETSLIKSLIEGAIKAKRSPCTCVAM